MRGNRIPDIIKWSEWNNSEKPALCLLKEMGYQYKEKDAFLPETSPVERQGLRETILSSRLIGKIKEFNPWINDTNIKQVLRKLNIPSTSSRIEFNRFLCEILRKPHTLVVEQDLGDGRGRRNLEVILIDWNAPERNEFLCTNQFAVSGSHGTCIPDIVVFVNGLPFIVIECKSPLISQPMEAGIRQVIDYQVKVPRLFNLNQIVIIAAGQAARYGVIGNSYAHFLQWKDPYPNTSDDLEQIVTRTGRTTTKPTPQDVLLYGLLEPHNLLDIIRNFIVFETDQGNLIKKIARYQQFRATNKTLSRIFSGSERGGTIWHTQGSGKSLTMIFTAIKLRRAPALENPLLVFVTDRIDLIDQLNMTFRACNFPNVLNPQNAEDLQNLIRNGQGQTIFTNIQKFRLSNAESEEEAETGDAEVYPVLNESDKIVVIIDEAHRSQYKTFAMRMRKSMPNAVYLAYTGTPLARTEKNEVISVGKGKTVRKFGSFIDIYNIREAVEDGAIVQIFYENRLPELKIEGISLDELFERIFAEKTPEEREAIKKKYVNKDAILGADERIKRVCLDIIDHYEHYVKPNNFKAQVVVNSRELAIKYKKYLDIFHAPQSVVIISPNLRYDGDLKKQGVKFITDKLQQKVYINRFKDPADPLKLLIVCDMLITGFDAPVEQVMYLDKSLREHNLLQAIARVNRTAGKKTHGLIVDYYGISLKMEEALEIFDHADIEGMMVSIEREVPRLEINRREAMRFIDGLDRSDLEHIVLEFENEEKRADFHSAVKKFALSLELILPNPVAEPYLKDIKLLNRILAALRVRYRDENLNIADCGGKVKEIINAYVRSDGITQLVEPVSILTAQFQEELKKLKSPESKASEMEHALRHEISVKIEEDPIFFTSLKERLEKIIEMYRKERIDLAEKIRELQGLIEEFKSRPARADSLGLSPTEIAFFDICKRELNSISITDSLEIKNFTCRLLECLEPCVSLVDWTLKETIHKQLRRGIKELLHEKNPSYSLDHLNEVAQEIINLAKVHYGS